MSRSQSRSRAQQFLESWKDAEKFHHDYAQQNTPLAHHYNKLLADHIGMAKGNDRRVRGRAKAVLRHFVKWQDAEQGHKDKHKKLPTMDDLAAQKPKALKSWAHYKRHVAPKEKRYHREAWMLNQEVELRRKGKE